MKKIMSTLLAYTNSLCCIVFYNIFSATLILLYITGYYGILIRKIMNFNIIMINIININKIMNKYNK